MYCLLIKIKAFAILQNKLQINLISFYLSSYKQIVPNNKAIFFSDYFYQFLPLPPPPFFLSKSRKTRNYSRDFLLIFFCLFVCFFFNRMTDEERGEMEKQVKSLQESYSLLSHEALKQLQEAQYLDDEKMEEKVARWKLRYQGLLSFTAWF